MITDGIHERMVNGRLTNIRVMPLGEMLNPEAWERLEMIRRKAAARRERNRKKRQNQRARKLAAMRSGNGN